jgi:MinD superfamily P-loop ATPase
MKIIAVTGGKGGVGKSTVAVWLFDKWLNQDKRAILLDADVECPNDHLLLGKTLDDKVREVFAHFPVFDKQKCQKCGLCVDKCRFHALFQPKDGYPVLIEDLCSGCGLCWHLCPYNAISQKKQVIGEVFEKKITSRGWLIAGRAKEVVDETGPVVRACREYVSQRVRQTKAEVVLIDTAPGIHCSVIQALWQVDLAYVVTEPTPLGAHDLKLILKLAQELGIKTKVVLNQADLGKKQLITKVLADFDLKIDLEISYSKKLAQKYSKGKLFPFPKIEK